MDKPEFRLEREPNTYTVWCSNCGEIATNQITTEANKVRSSHNCETFKQSVQHRNVFENK